MKEEDTGREENPESGRGKDEGERTPDGAVDTTKVSPTTHNWSIPKLAKQGGGC